MPLGGKAGTVGDTEYNGNMGLELNEYDFRFEDLNSAERLERVRTALLETARGFTEIQLGVLPDYIPGKGHAFIVGLKSAEQARQLQRKLSVLANEWNVPCPQLVAASEGRRANSCFFLLPEKANADQTGFRRDLFTSQRSIDIRNALIANGATRTIVYGQWTNEREEIIEDSSALYLMFGNAEQNEQYLRTFIEQRIFDNGIQCDQTVIYLSVEGKGYWISEKD